jgi:hypothetical protein
LKDRADCELPHALPVSSECVCQLLHNWDRGLSPLYANCFWIPAIRYPTRNRTPRRVMEAKKLTQSGCNQIRITDYNKFR